MKKKMFQVIVSVLCCISTAVMADGPRYDWTGAVSSDWNVLGNWTTSEITEPNASSWTVVSLSNGPIISTGSTALSDDCKIAENPDTTGKITVEGGNFTLNRLYVGYLGSGLLQINSGSTIINGMLVTAYGAMAAGDVNIAGGSLSTGQNITLGDWGTSALNITNGGSLTSTAACYVAGNGTANVLVSGSDSSYQTNGITVVGLGPATTGTFTVAGGSVSSAMFFVGDNGVADVNVSSGTLSTTGGFVISAWPAATGTLNVSGGQVNIGSFFFVGDRGNGNVVLSGGTITCNGVLVMNNNTSQCNESKINLCGGELRIGVITMETLQGFIDAGKIVAYDGEPGYQFLIQAYGANGLKIKAVSEIDIATNPSPADGSIDERPDVQLSWTPWDGASSQEVYLGTDHTAVQDANTGSPLHVATLGATATSYKPAADLTLGTTYYWKVKEIGSSSEPEIWSFTILTCNSPNLGDLNNDCVVDFIDFATLAENWLKVIWQDL